MGFIGINKAAPKRCVLFYYQHPDSDSGVKKLCGLPGPRKLQTVREKLWFSLIFEVVELKVSQFA